MPLDAFWYGDMRLLEVYQKAYMRNSAYNAWLIGGNVNAALNKFFNNSNVKSKAQIDFSWIKYEDPVEKLFKPKTISKNDMEIEYRRRQAQDKEFVQRLLNRS